MIINLGGTVANNPVNPGIYINNISVASGSSLNTVIPTGYDSSYDALFYFNDWAPSGDIISILDNWYNNNKGVVLAAYATGLYSNGTAYSNVITKHIATYNNFPSGSNGNSSYTLNSNHPILYGIPNIVPSQYCSQFSPINGATGLGDLNGANLLTYLDDTTGKGRRIDMNLYGAGLSQGFTGVDRTILQSMLWAARKI